MIRFLNLFFIFANVLYTRLHIWLSGIKRETVTYAVSDGREMKLDIYRPKTAHGRVPVIIYTHGGGWRIGSRRVIEPAFLAQVKRGYALVSVSYSFSNKAHWPVQMHEVKAAYRWVRAHADTYGFDADKLIAAGASAGGHLACVAGLSGPGILEGALGNAGTSSDVCGIIVYYPPTDLLEISEKGRIGYASIRDLLGGAVADKAEALKQATPMTYARADGPPLYVMQGTADHVVPYRQGPALVDAVKAAGGDAQLITLEGIAHADWRFNGKKNRPGFEAFLDRVTERSQVTAK